MHQTCFIPVFLDNPVKATLSSRWGPKIREQEKRKNIKKEGENAKNMKKGKVKEMSPQAVAGRAGSPGLEEAVARVQALL